MFIRHITALTIALAPFHSMAACEIESAVRAAKSQSYESGDLIACKRVPKSTDTIVSFIKNKNTESPIFFVIVVGGSEQISSKWQSEETMFGWGYPNDIRIDTAPYLIAPHKRAFGVRVKSSLNSWDSIEVMSLYIQNKKILSHILKYLEVSSGFGRGLGGEGCYERARNEKTISIGPISTNGYYDLLINIRNEEENSLPPNPETQACAEGVPNVRKSMVIYKFINGQYQ